MASQPLLDGCDSSASIPIPSKPDRFAVHLNLPATKSQLVDAEDQNGNAEWEGPAKPCSFEALMMVANQIRLVEAHAIEKYCQGFCFSSFDRFVDYLNEREGHHMTSPREAGSSSVLSVHPDLRRSFCWIDLPERPSRELAQFCDIFRLDMVTQEDILEQTYDFEKASVFERRGYMSVFMQCEHEASDQMIKCVIVLFRDWVITIHNGSVMFFASALSRLQDQELERANRETDQAFGTERAHAIGKRYPIDSASRLLAGPAWVLFTLLDLDLDRMMRISEQLMGEAERVNDLVFLVSEAEESDILRRISVARSRCMRLQQQLDSKERLLLDLDSSRSAHFIPSEFRKLFQDVHSHLRWSIQRCNCACDLLNQANANYLTRINLSAAVTANRINELMRKLTWTILITAPFNIMGGLGGMNIRNPWTWTVDLYYDDKGISYCSAWFSIIAVFTFLTGAMIACVFYPNLVSPRAWFRRFFR